MSQQITGTGLSWAAQSHVLLVYIETQVLQACPKKEKVFGNESVGPACSEIGCSILEYVCRPR